MLQSILEAGISNVVVASVLALLVFALTRFWRNPHIAHMLWLLVLAKLVTPPLWHVSISLPPVLSEFTWRGDASRRHEGQFVSSRGEVAEAANWAQATQRLDDHPRNQASVQSYGSAPSSAEKVSTVDASAAPHEAIREGLANSVQDGPDRVRSSLAILVSLWIAGSLVWVTVLSTRLVYFNRLLGQTLPATAELKCIAEMVAKKLALRRLPNLRLTEAAVSPMVWPAAYRPMVVLPKQLIDNMGSEQVTAIVAHEFAHLRRADHWVRFLELIVVSLYWWNPIV